MQNNSSQQHAPQESRIPAILILDPHADADAVAASLTHFAVFIPDNVKTVVITTGGIPDAQLGQHVQFLQTTPINYAGMVGQLKNHVLFEWIAAAKAGQLLPESAITGLSRHRHTILDLPGELSKAPAPVAQPAPTTLASAMSGMLKTTPIN